MGCRLFTSEFSLVTSLMDARLVPTVITLIGMFLVALTALRWAAKGNTAAATRLAMAWGWLVVPFLPASNLFFYVGFVVAER